jgi:geranylgeranyl diphosphate synthase type II
LKNLQTAPLMSSAVAEGLSGRLAAHRAAVESALDRYSQSASGSPQRLTEALRYSLLSPGKRLRPLLVLLAAEAVGGDWKDALPPACAVEMIHAYSLIHDDLPAMDDDDLRRGQPTCHRKFDEATAILAGDALQALAFEVIARDTPAECAARCCLQLAEAAGRCQLVGGQADDLAAEGRYGAQPFGETPEEQLQFLQRIHERKTGAMIAGSVRLGGLAVGAAEPALASLEHFGRRIGLAFQIVDDLLDVESSPETMGKHTGKDESRGKLTYPGLLGIDASRQWAQRLITEACTQLDSLGEPAAPLIMMAKFVLERKN